MKEPYDVCVIGAGPAGTSMANRLADFGYRVILLEKEQFPRKHIGLSITPGIRHWLDILTIQKKVDSLDFQPALRSLVLWNSPTPRIKDFMPRKAGYHLDRGKFDSLLVKECIAKNVEVHLGVNISDLRNTGTSWEMNVKQSNEMQSIKAQFLVDASGRHSVLKSKKRGYLPKLMATYSFWKGEQEFTDYSFIEAGENHWYWGAPLSKNEFVSCVFTDSSQLKRSKSLEAHYHEKLRKSTLMPAITEMNSPSKVYTCDATAYSVEDPIGSNYIKIGDAAFTMDPISSQGVQKAIKSGIQGAMVVNTLLKNSENSSAFQFYNQLISSEVKKNKGWTSDFYAEQKAVIGGEFWKCRKPLQSAHNNKKNINDRLSLRKNDVLRVNPNGNFISVPILGETTVIEVEGFKLLLQEEPYVFVESIEISALLKELHGKTVKECILTTSNFPNVVDAFKIIQYLLYHQLLIT